MPDHYVGAALVVIGVTWLTVHLLTRGLRFTSTRRDQGDRLAADHYGLPAPDASNAEWLAWAIEALNLGNAAAFEAAVLSDIDVIARGEAC